MILASRSVAFASMLTAPRLVLEDMEASVVKEHLDFLYGGTFQHTMLNENTLKDATKRFSYARKP